MFILSFAHFTSPNSHFHYHIHRQFGHKKKKHKTDVDVSSFRLQPKIIGGRNDSMLSYSCFVPQNRIKKQQNETNQKMKSD